MLLFHIDKCLCLQHFRHQIAFTHKKQERFAFQMQEAREGIAFGDDLQKYADTLFFIISYLLESMYFQ